MQPIRREDLDALVSAGEAPCLTLFASMVQSGPQVRQNSIRFRNLLRQADTLLEKRDMRPADRERFLEPLVTLGADEDFWNHQDGTLCVLRSGTRFQHFRLEGECEDMVTVGERFHVVRLIDDLNRDVRFRLLLLSQDDMRLYDGDRNGLKRVDLAPEAPTSIVEALGPQQVGPSNDYHGNFKMPGGHGPGAGGNLFHVQGYSDASPKSEMRKFFQMIDAALVDAVEEKDLPVVLAGVEYEVAMYREVTKFPNIVEEYITGSPTKTPEGVLFERAFAIMAPWLSEAPRRAAERWPVLLQRERASQDLAEVLAAAADGRVDTLLIARDAHRWGTFDDGTRKVRLDDEATAFNEDLIGRAALYTYLTRGAVHVVDRAALPQGATDLAALYRY